jgi:copper(I)-binding protein
VFSFRNARRALILSCLFAPTAGLADIVISDAYARASRPNAPTGAAFLVIENNGSDADRLVAAQSGAAQRVELHTHVDLGDGVMKMTEIEGGIEIPAGGTHVMRRGGDHVMLMGLTKSLEQGGEIAVTLTFEQAGTVEVVIPVDNDRQPDHGQMQHGSKN